MSAVGAPTKPAISSFERYLSLWVALCIIVGIALGYALPGLFAAIAAAEIARVNLVVAALIWLMIIPMLLKIDRSEEHTSELQSLMRISYAVFCLKKKKKQYNKHTSTT